MVDDVRKLITRFPQASKSEQLAILARLGTSDGEAVHALPLLAANLSERDVDLRRAAALALTHWGELVAPIQDQLIDALQDPDARVRARAAICLASLNDPDLIPEILPLTEDADAHVRKMASYAVRQMSAA